MEMNNVEKAKLVVAIDKALRQLQGYSDSLLKMSGQEEYRQVERMAGILNTILRNAKDNPINDDYYRGVQLTIPLIVQYTIECIDELFGHLEGELQKIEETWAPIPEPPMSPEWDISDEYHCAILVKLGLHSWEGDSIDDIMENDKTLVEDIKEGVLGCYGYVTDDDVKTWLKKTQETWDQQGRNIHIKPEATK